MERKIGKNSETLGQIGVNFESLKTNPLKYLQMAGISTKYFVDKRKLNVFCLFVFFSSKLGNKTKPRKKINIILIGLKHFKEDV